VHDEERPYTRLHTCDGPRRRNRAPKRLYGNYTREIGEIWSREMRCGHPSLSRPAMSAPDRPTGCPACRSLSRLACVCTHTEREREREPGNTVPWIHCCPIMDQPMLAFALRINTLRARDARRSDASLEFRRCCGYI